jgi:hypothetical protein
MAILERPSKDGNRVSFCQYLAACRDTKTSVGQFARNLARINDFLCSRQSRTTTATGELEIIVACNLNPLLGDLDFVVAEYRRFCDDWF